MDPILIVVLVAVAVIALGAVAYVAIRGRGTTQVGPGQDASLESGSVEVMERPGDVLEEIPTEVVGDAVVLEEPAVAEPVTVELLPALRGTGITR